MFVRPLKALLGLSLALSAPALGQDSAVEQVAQGSSGKYFALEPDACAAARTDALQVARLQCEQSGTSILGEPSFGACACERGGFEEKEWLCSSTATYRCETRNQAAPQPAAAPTTTTLDLPGTVTRIQLLDRAFARRGVTLPADVLDERLTRACADGWALACDTSSWKEHGRPTLAKARPSLDKACAGGDADACIAWGWSREAEAIATNNPEAFRAAARTYKGLCDDASNATACYDYGTILFNELGVSADPRLGVRRWESACEQGEPAACSALSRVYAEGLRLPADRDKAQRFAAHACESGDDAGCITAASLRGDDRAVTRARVAACRHGDREQCWALANATTAPEGVQTIDLLAMACDLGQGAACARAGRAALEQGDAEDASARFRRACEVGQVDGCVGLVELIESERAPGDVFDDQYAYEVACSRGEHPQACATLGMALLDNESGRADKPRARALLRQSCVDATSPARTCFVLGEMYETGAGGNRDRTLAAKYYKWACAQGWGDACERRGELLAEGVGVRLDEAEAVVSYQLGCDAGSPRSCLRAGVLLDQGTHIPRDAKRALGLYAIACERGEGEACVRHGNLSLDPVIGRDEEQARASYEKAVSLRNVEAHRRLAYMLWNGLGGKKNKKRARQLTAAGCREADPIACRGPAFQTEGR